MPEAPSTIAERILAVLADEPIDFKTIQLKLLAQTNRPTPDITVRMALTGLASRGDVWRPSRGIYALADWSAPATGPTDSVDAWVKAHCATIKPLEGFSSGELSQAYRMQFKCTLPEDVFDDAIKLVPHVVATGLHSGRQYYVRTA